MINVYVLISGATLNQSSLPHLRVVNCWREVEGEDRQRELVAKVAPLTDSREKIAFSVGVGLVSHCPGRGHANHRGGAAQTGWVPVPGQSSGAAPPAARHPISRGTWIYTSTYRQGPRTSSRHVDRRLPVPAGDHCRPGPTPHRAAKVPVRLSTPGHRPLQVDSLTVTRLGRPGM